MPEVDFAHLPRFGYSSVDVFSIYSLNFYGQMSFKKAIDAEIFETCVPCLFVYMCLR